MAFGINDPFDASQRDEEGGERLPISEICVNAEELQAVGLVRLGQHLQK